MSGEGYYIDKNGNRWEGKVKLKCFIGEFVDGVY